MCYIEMLFHIFSWHFLWQTSVFIAKVAARVDESLILSLILPSGTFYAIWNVFIYRTRYNLLKPFSSDNRDQHFTTQWQKGYDLNAPRLGQHDMKHTRKPKRTTSYPELIFYIAGNALLADNAFICSGQICPYT